MTIHHLNCGLLQAPGCPAAACHCLLLESESRLVLVDTGIGLQDIQDPLRRVGQVAIDAAGFQFHEHLTAARQIAALGWSPRDVTEIVLTHGDADHAGGLVDFPRRGSISEIYLLPLFGHTLGHCGVAIQDGDSWLVHVGDAYYLRVELSDDRHPISQLTALRAMDDWQRRESLEKIRQLAQHRNITTLGYHDFSEFPVRPSVRRRQQTDCHAGDASLPGPREP